MKFEDNNLGKGQVDFLIKEMESLSRERQEVSDLQEKRLSSYSVIIGFSISFVGYLLGSEKLESEGDFPILLPLFIGFVGLTVICTGLITYTRVLYRQIQVEKFRNTLKEYKNILLTLFKLNDQEDLTRLIKHEISDVKILNRWVLSISSIITLLNSLFITVYSCTFFRFTFLRDTNCRKMLIPLAILIYLSSMLFHILVKYIIENKYKSKS